MKTYDLIPRKTQPFSDQYILVPPSAQDWSSDRPFRSLSLNTAAWPFPNRPNRLEIRDSDATEGQSRTTVGCRGNHRGCPTEEFWLVINNPGKPGDVALYHSESRTAKRHRSVENFWVENGFLGGDHCPDRLKIILSDCNQPVRSVFAD